MFCFVFGGLLASQLARLGQSNNEDVIQFLTTMADESLQGQYFSSAAYNADAVSGLRTSVFGLGTTRLTLEINNLADRGVTSRGVCIYLQDLTRQDILFLGMF